MSSLDASSVASLLDAKRSGNGWSACCPVHPDKNASLTISQGSDGKLLLYCHAGCSFGEIIHALGLDTSTPRPKQKITSLNLTEALVQGYRYKMTEGDFDFLSDDRCIDRTNVAAYEIGKYGNQYSIPIRNNKNELVDLRFYTPKQHRKENTPKMMPFQPGIKAQLFPFSSLGTDTSLPIYICEGELDAIALKSIGLVSITNTCGANAWKEDWATHFADRDVIIVMDNDDAGQKGARKRQNSLEGIARSIKQIAWPADRSPGHDVIDEIKLRGIESLRELLKTSFTPREELFVRLDTVETKPVSWLWNPYLPRKAVTFLNGEPGKGKSFATTALCSLITTGQKFPDGQECDAQNVLILAAEDGLDTTVKPRMEMHGGDLTRCFAFKSTEIIDKDVISEIERHVREFRPALVVIDPFNAYFGKDANKAENVRPFIKLLTGLAIEYDLAVLVIHHWNKGGVGVARTSLARQMGSVDLTAGARSVLSLGVNPNDPDGRVIVHTKSNLAKSGPSIGFKIVNQQVQWQGIVTVSEEQIFQQKEENTSKLTEAEEFLKENLSSGKIAQKDLVDLAKELDISAATIKRAKEKLRIKSTKIGGEWFWQLADCTNQEAQEAQEAHLQ